MISPTCAPRRARQLRKAAVLGAATIALGFSAHLVTGGLLSGGRASLDDVALPLPGGGRINIARLTFQTGFGLITPAFADDAVLQNVTIDSGGTIYRMDRIEITGSNLAQRQLAAIFDGTAKEPVARRLATLSAKEVKIPTMVMETAAEKGTRITAIRDMSFRDIAGGKAGTMTATGGSIKEAGENGGFGAISARDFDLALMAGLTTETLSDAPKQLLTSFSWNNIWIDTAQGGKFRIERATSSDVRMKAGALKPSPAQPADTAPKYGFPAIGNVAFHNLSLEFPDSSARGALHKWTIRNVAMMADQLRNNMPTAARLSIEDWSATLPKASVQGGLRELQGLGYESVSASVLLEGAFNEASNEFAIKAVTLDFAEVGSVTFSGTLGNITSDNFASNSAVASAAFGRATAKLLSVSFENRGIYERAVAIAAKKEGKPPETIRKEFEAVAAKLIPTLFGSSPNAQIIGGAVAAFIAKPGKVEVTAKSKVAEGVPLTDFRSVGGRPAASVDKLEITATAK